MSTAMLDPPVLGAPTSACTPELHLAGSHFFRNNSHGPGPMQRRRMMRVVKAVHNGNASGQPSAHWDSNTDREERLWQRQERLWEREIERWDEERRAWATREQMLLGQVARLQALVVHLSANQSGTADRRLRQSESIEAAQHAFAEQGYPSLSSPEADAAAAQQRSALSQSSVGTAAAPSPQGIAARPAHSSSSPTSAVTAASEDVGMKTASLAADLAAAISAVDLTDVLTEESPFAAAKAMHTSTAPRVEATSSPPEEAPAAASAAPPMLAHGADDIFWVAHLHTALDAAGYYPGEEEMEAWLFGEGTLSALLTFQATQGLEETGVCDTDTWRSLLGPEALAARLAQAAGLQGVGSNPESSPVNQLNGSSGSAGAHALTSRAVTEDAGAPEAPQAVPKSSQLKKWPLLREGDGGQHVHALQASLHRKGYYCGEDDAVWWQFGMDTQSSLTTFQACYGLSETGVADAATWKALLGPDAQPSDVESVKSDDHTDEDMQGGDRVWLLGEQRWEIRQS